MKIKKLLQGVSVASVMSFLITVQAFAVEANNSLELSIASKTDSQVVVDLHVQNPSNQQITSVQSWLQFDSTKLKGISIDTTDSPFDFVVPGESNFDGNLVKIGRSTLSGDTSSSKVFVAKITFEILSFAESEISFYDYQAGDGGHVSIQVFDNGFPINTLSSEPNSLKIEGKTPVKTEATTATETKSSLQAQDLNRPSSVTLDSAIGSATLSWDQVTGASKYYIYYGKTSGRYLNRRMIGNVNTYTLEGLETGKRYFFALTAIGDGNKESDYSNETSVVIGKPKTSTALPVENYSNTQATKSETKKTINSTTTNYKVNTAKIPQNTESGPAEIALISLLFALAAAFGIRKLKLAK